MSGTLVLSGRGVLDGISIGDVARGGEDGMSGTLVLSGTGVLAGVVFDCRFSLRGVANTVSRSAGMAALPPRYFMGQPSSCAPQSLV